LEEDRNLGGGFQEARVEFGLGYSTKVEFKGPFCWVYTIDIDQSMGGDMNTAELVVWRLIIPVIIDMISKSNPKTARSGVNHPSYKPTPSCSAKSTSSGKSRATTAIEPSSGVPYASMTHQDVAGDFGQEFRVDGSYLS